jgi:hypothetical protein
MSFLNEKKRVSCVWLHNRGELSHTQMGVDLIGIVGPCLPVHRGGGGMCGGVGEAVLSRCWRGFLIR